MFILKDRYFLIIESIEDINLKSIKTNRKFCIIYRNSKYQEDLRDLFVFRKKCKTKRISFFIANNLYLARILKCDGVYISASNKSFKPLNLKNFRMEIIGSAHNIKEIDAKKKQGCEYIIVSKLFKVDYDLNSNFLGINKFNNLLKNNKRIIPLGGIKLNNLNKLRIINSKGLAIMSEIKKKPAISSRLF